MLPAIHRYARLGVVSALVCAAGAACLSAGSSNPPKVEATAPTSGAGDARDSAEAGPDHEAMMPADMVAGKKHGTAIAPDDLTGPTDDANSQNATNINDNDPDKAPKKPAHDARPTEGAANNDASTVQLSPYNLTLPRGPDDVSDAVRAFNIAAVRAVQRVYREDGDDPSVLLALQDQLAQREALRPVRPVWEGPLSSAMARATTLQALGPTLRALRTAMANAYFDERLRLYRDVDAKACETAFNSLPSQDETLLNFVVTVEPIGTYPLGKFRSFCAASRSTALREKQLPGKPAPAALVRLVRHLYNQAHLGGQVRSVSVLQPWQRDGEQKQSTLHAAVGVVRADGNAGDEPCSVAEISVVKALNSNEPAVISEVGEREPILCEQLK